MRDSLLLIKSRSIVWLKDGYVPLSGVQGSHDLESAHEAPGTNDDQILNSCMQA